MSLDLLNTTQEAMKKKKAHMLEKIVSAACQGWWRSSGRLKEQNILKYEGSLVPPWNTKCVQKEEGNRAEEAGPSSEVIELGLTQVGGQVCRTHAHRATEGDQLRGGLNITFLTFDLTVTSTRVKPLPLLR